MYKRWAFTVNNYNIQLATPDYYSNVSFDVKRCVVGREFGANGTPHLQGYLEFNRSRRLNSCKAIHPNGHWEGAKGTAKQNYKYCTKEGNYFIFGDWDDVIKGPKRKIDHLKEVIKELFEDPHSSVKNSSNYIRHKRVIDERLMELRNQAANYEHFEMYKSKKLSEWQIHVLEELFNQDNRKVLWVFDTIGGCGKSFLAHYIQHCYGYDLFDGVTAAKDIVFLLSAIIRGIVFDVTRSDSKHFSYQTLEACKNGFVMTGKYAGARRVFKPVPVVVFANFAPELERLSCDRWDIIDLQEYGTEGPYTEDPSTTWAFVSPQAVSFLEKEAEDEGTDIPPGS